MTPRRRAKENSSESKVYRSRKVPQQTRFPERKKIVRRPSAQDGPEKRQAKLLPDKMKRNRVVVADSDEEEDEKIEDEEVEEENAEQVANIKKEHAEGSTPRAAKTRGKKRTSDTMQDPKDLYEEEEPPATSKRRKKTPIRTPRARTKQLKVKSEDDEPAPSTARSNSHSTKSARRRRQSTMTQMVDGRLPLSDAEEPDFKPVKRSSRQSTGRGSKNKSDKKQRTLTQMVPGLTSFEMFSDDHMTEAMSDNEAPESVSRDQDVISAHLLEEGLLQKSSDDGAAVGGVTKFEEITSEDDAEAEYHPTQFIEAPVTRMKRTRSRRPMREGLIVPSTHSQDHQPRGILSTPKKRQDRIIPSSQSPADSPLHTPVSLRQRRRSPLDEVAGNAAQSAQTPSKRKQVAFQELKEEQHAPPSLRKFRSVIQDSEDEDDELLEWDQAADSQPKIVVQWQDVGAETQAVLQQIDEACANAGPDSGLSDEGPSSRHTSPCQQFLERGEASPELGESLTRPNGVAEEDDGPPANYTRVKAEPVDEVDMAELPAQQISVPRSPQRTQQCQIKAEMADAHMLLPLPSTPPVMEETDIVHPSSPILVKDEPSQDEGELDVTPPSTARRTAWQEQQTAEIQHSEDLDGHPIQVPRSPSVEQHETQQSHSSKAEQQIQSEWCSYSQYVGARTAQSSSMHVAADKFSYHATPLPPPRDRVIQQPFSHQYSQATTVDEVTPKKDRTRRLPSTNTTPRRVPSSQPFVSPVKPPPLFIPSSFPSPAKARMEDWSSPVLNFTQNTYGAGALGGSIEDFSIPLPPPEDDD